jgi:hypothetical protein
LGLTYIAQGRERRAAAQQEQLKSINPTLAAKLQQQIDARGSQGVPNASQPR